MVWKIVFLAVLFPAAAVLGQAQVSISGLYDFELRKGGWESSLATNGLPNNHLQIGVHQLQIFLDASVSEDISFIGKIANNFAKGWALKEIEVQLAHVTFYQLFGANLNFSAGRILTPFGAYPKRQLSSSNPHIGHPLFFHYRYNVSSSLGYLDSSTAILARSAYGGRLGAMYTGAYYSGAELFGTLFDGFFEYDVAAMNAPLSSSNEHINLNRNVAVHGRIALHPAVWGSLGFSFSSGSFMERLGATSSLDPVRALNDPERFKQETIGLDLSLSYHHYELNAEYINNVWKAPYILYKPSVPPIFFESVLPQGEHLKLGSHELLVDARIDAPFYPGLYVAGRYNAVRFGKITDHNRQSASFGKEIPWEADLTRYAVTVGYKPARMVLIKAGYEWTHVDVEKRPDLGFAALQISVTF